MVSFVHSFHILNSIWRLQARVASFHSIAFPNDIYDLRLQENEKILEKSLTFGPQNTSLNLW